MWYRPIQKDLSTTPSAANALNKNQSAHLLFPASISSNDLSLLEKPLLTWNAALEGPFAVETVAMQSGFGVQALQRFRPRVLAGGSAAGTFLRNAAWPTAAGAIFNTRIMTSDSVNHRGCSCGFACTAAKFEDALLIAVRCVGLCGVTAQCSRQERRLIIRSTSPVCVSKTDRSQADFAAKPSHGGRQERRRRIPPHCLQTERLNGNRCIPAATAAHQENIMSVPLPNVRHLRMRSCADVHSVLAAYRRSGCVRIDSPVSATAPPI